MSIHRLFSLLVCRFTFGMPPCFGLAIGLTSMLSGYCAPYRLQACNRAMTREYLVPGNMPCVARDCLASVYTSYDSYPLYPLRYLVPYLVLYSL